MSEAITTARPYAQAAFEEALKLGDLKGWSEILLTSAEAVIHPEVRAVITSPRILKAQIEKLMEGFLGSEVKPQQLNFIRVLVDNQRLLLLPEIVVIFPSIKGRSRKNRECCSGLRIRIVCCTTVKNHQFAESPHGA